MVTSYVSFHKNYVESSADQLWGANNKVLNGMIRNTNLWQVMNSFTNIVVFAIGVLLYWKVPSEETENYHRLKQMPGNYSIEEMKKKQLSYELSSYYSVWVVTIKYQVIPKRNGEKVDAKQYDKYGRNNESKNGIINSLYCKTDCNCMKTKKVEANNMDKMELFLGCRKFFLKTRMKICDGCIAVVYCSKNAGLLIGLGTDYLLILHKKGEKNQQKLTMCNAKITTTQRRRSQ